MTPDCGAWKWEQWYLSLEKLHYNLQAEYEVRRWAPSQLMEREESPMGEDQSLVWANSFIPWNLLLPPAPSCSVTTLPRGNSFKTTDWEWVGFFSLWGCTMCASESKNWSTKKVTPNARHLQLIPPQPVLSIHHSTGQWPIHSPHSHTWP